jgi:hypothetical protein
LLSNQELSLIPFYISRNGSIKMKKSQKLWRNKMLKLKRWLCVNNNDLNIQTTKKVGFWHFKRFCLSCIHAYGDQKWLENSWEGNCTTSIKLELIEVMEETIIWWRLNKLNVIYNNLKIQKKKLFIHDEHDISKEDVEGLGF